MFENKVDLTKVYGVKRVAYKPSPTSGEARIVKTFDPTTARKKAKKKAEESKVIDASKTWYEYQELRQTKPFKYWWWEQKARQRGLCYYCLKDLDYGVINVEHVKPMSAGGTNDYNNLVLSCQPCNKAKGSNVLSKSKRKQLKASMEEALRVKKFIDDNIYLMTDFEIGVWASMREMDKKFRDNGV